jgi:hypothetical protein
VGNPGRKRPLGRPRHRWEGNIKMDLQFAIQSIKIKINRTIIFPVFVWVQNVVAHFEAATWAEGVRK